MLEIHAAIEVLKNTGDVYAVRDSYPAFYNVHYLGLLAASSYLRDDIPSRVKTVKRCTTTRGGSKQKV